MKKSLFVLPLAALLLPFTVSAHQHAEFEIGGVQYSFIVGSLNEPVTVDDKTGVEFRVSMVGHEDMAANDHHAVGGAVTGLEQTLQVELIAGGERKVLDLSPTYNTPGSYYAAFYPTTNDPISYRFFGTINETPVDITFACRAEGAVAADEGEKEISVGVKQLSKSGGFGCFAEKEALGFPQASASVASVQGSAQSAKLWGMAGTLLGVLGLGAALMRRK